MSVGTGLLSLGPPFPTRLTLRLRTVVGRPADAERDLVRGGGARRSHADRHDPAHPANAGDPVTVVAPRRDQARHLRAVTVRVLRNGVVFDEVPPGHQRASQIGIGWTTVSTTAITTFGLPIVAPDAAGMPICCSDASADQ